MRGGGNVELVRTRLGDIVAPVLLIAAENDLQNVKANQGLLAGLNGQKELETVAGVKELFTQQGSVNEVIRLAGAWFKRWLVTIV